MTVLPQLHTVFFYTFSLLILNAAHGFREVACALFPDKKIF